VQAVPTLCRADATVIWTRHRRPPDLTPQVRAWSTDEVSIPPFIGIEARKARDRVT
jgi:hypothetical protein